MSEQREEIWHEWHGMNPRVAAAKSGVAFDQGEFRLPYHNRSFAVSYPQGGVREVGGRVRVSSHVEIFMRHYIAQASGVPIEGRWIAFRELPDSFPLHSGYIEVIINPLVRAFGTRREAFVKAAQSLGGTPLSRFGDAAFYFFALPKLLIACILYLADDELPAEVNILFDASAPRYLPTEDLFCVAEDLSILLRQRDREAKETT
ncbi:MAG: DUF3786 domain-containing protein [Chloroflexi bacterium]|nr:DUF3786 domain-containing protein [Chloroflexota bacterium]